MKRRLKAIMKEVRVLRRLLDKHGVNIGLHWLSSAENNFYDKQSRIWDPGDLEVAACLCRELIKRYAHVKLSSDGVWNYRPLGIHPVAARKVALGALEEDWGSERARLFLSTGGSGGGNCEKFAEVGGRESLLAPNWPAAPWITAVKALEQRT